MPSTASPDALAAQNELPVETHPFLPFLPPNGRMLFLGSFPPTANRWCMHFYYPNFINDFWRIMGHLFFDDRQHFVIADEKRFDETAIRRFAAEEGLAFFDTARRIRRLKGNASDAFLEVVEATDISSLLAPMPHCNRIVTTGRQGALRHPRREATPQDRHLRTLPGQHTRAGSRHRLLAHALLIASLSAGSRQESGILSLALRLKSATRPHRFPTNSPF